MDIEKARLENPGMTIDSVFDMELNGLPRTSVDRETHRKIPIRDEDVPVIERHLLNLQSNHEAGTSFAKTYDSCRKLLHRTCMEIFKGEKVYTFYSFRHQFAANGKTKYTREQLAVIMGHDAIKSSENSYASRRFADKRHKEDQRDRNRKIETVADAGAAEKQRQVDAWHEA